MADIDVFLRLVPEQKADVKIDDLFGDYRRPKATDWTIPQAFICLLMAAAAADNVVTNEELSEIEALFKRSRTLKLLQGKDLTAARLVAMQRLKERPSSIQEACETLPEDMRMPVFAHCLDIILSDGDLVPTEAQFLKSIVGFLALDAAKVQEVTHVLFQKNKY